MEVTVFLNALLTPLFTGYATASDFR